MQTPSPASDTAVRAQPWRPTVAHVALLLPWVLAVVGALRPIGDNSFLWHVTAGNLQIRDGAVLTTDPFSFTFTGQPWRTQSWLADLGYSVLDDAFGLAFVSVMLIIGAVLTFGAVLLAAYRASRSLEATVIVGVLTAWLSAVFLNPRPVLFSYLLLAVVVLVAPMRKLRWSLPLIAFVWAALHGSFVLGIGYVVLHGLRSRRREAIADTGAMLVAASLTAHGLGVWQVLLEFSRSGDALALITEWRTPELTGVELLPFLIGLILMLVGGIRGRLSLADLWIVVPFLVFGMQATRSVFPAFIPLAPLIARSLDGIPRSTRSRSALPVPLVVVGALLVLAPFLIPGEAGLSEDRFPVAAAAALTDERTFHDDTVGGYLIYRTGGEWQVFVDDRAELFGAEHFDDVIKVRSGTPRWRDVFDRWAITQAIVSADDGLVEALLDAGWTERHRDDRFVVLASSA